MRLTDITGIKFHRLTVVEKTAVRVAEKVMWRCACECGNTTLANSSQLRTGRRTSCGCAKKSGSQIYKRPPRHGHFVGNRPTPTYRAWSGMLNRCRNDRSDSWVYYGGRGIKVCDRWLTFENFLADMGEKPKGLSIDRKDNNGDYRPENCRWATDIEQHRNRSDSLLWTFKGETKTLAEWSEVTGINHCTLNSRVKDRGWDVAQSLTTPVQTKAQVAAKANLKRWGYRQP